jgi:hypothetical protein
MWCGAPGREPHPDEHGRTYDHGLSNAESAKVLEEARACKSVREEGSYEK